MIPRDRYELFDVVRKKWPKVVKIVKRDNTVGQYETDPSDIELYEEIVKSIGNNNEWEQIASWAFHQALGEKITECFKNGLIIVYTNLVDFHSFEDYLISNLEDESWSEEREIYHLLPKRHGDSQK
jgi:hypothetical protein